MHATISRWQTEPTGEPPELTSVLADSHSVDSHSLTVGDPHDVTKTTVYILRVYQATLGIGTKQNIHQRSVASSCSKIVSTWLSEAGVNIIYRELLVLIMYISNSRTRTNENVGLWTGEANWAFMFTSTPTWLSSWRATCSFSILEWIRRSFLSFFLFILKQRGSTLSRF